MKNVVIFVVVIVALMAIIGCNGTIPIDPVLVVNIEETDQELNRDETFDFNTDLDSDISTTLNWTSSDSNVATVDSNGVVTAVSEGTATISVVASASGYSNGSDSVVVTVVSPPASSGNPLDGTTWDEIIYSLLFSNNEVSLVDRADHSDVKEKTTYTYTDTTVSFSFDNYPTINTTNEDFTDNIITVDSEATDFILQ